MSQGMPNGADPDKRKRWLAIRATPGNFFRRIVRSFRVQFAPNHVSRKQVRRDRAMLLNEKGHRSGGSAFTAHRMTPKALRRKWRWQAESR